MTEGWLPVKSLSLKETVKMAYYANAKGNVPFSIREEERRWKKHMEQHQQSVRFLEAIGEMCSEK